MLKQKQKNTEIRLTGIVRRPIGQSGFGFLTPDPGQDLSMDVLFHDTVTRGLTDPIVAGTRMECFARFEPDRGLRVSRILSILPPLVVRAKVKWFNYLKGYGFLTVAGAPDIFVHVTKVQAAGLTTLMEGEWLTVRTGPREYGKGLAVTEILIGDAAIKAMRHTAGDSSERPNE
jgi:CspA family cold shock protein